MLTEQDLPGLITVGGWQVFDWAKSAGLAPPMAMALTLRAWPPLLTISRT